jgi:hypothetical protein
MRNCWNFLGFYKAGNNELANSHVTNINLVLLLRILLAEK